MYDLIARINLNLNLNLNLPVAAFLFLFCLVYLVFMIQIKGYWTTTSKGQRKMEICCRKYYFHKRDQQKW